VYRWCLGQGRPVGALLSLAQGWALARGWFSDPRQPNWTRPPMRVLAQLAAGLGLHGPFWEE
jgi:hypothetical protein